MPPRHTYWTILVGASPTAFRAAERADLVPTFERLREKHPEVVLKWFARGKLWDSPEAQRDAERAARFAARPEAPRDAGWRPGGAHQDPRDRFKKKPKDRDRRDRDRSEGQGREARPSRDRERSGKPAWSPKGPPRDREAFGKRPWTPKGPPRDREAFAKRPWTPKGPPRDRDGSGKPAWSPKGPPRDRKPFGKPAGDRRSDSRGFGPREGRPQPWRQKPGGPPPTPELPKPDERVEHSRKGGTRLVKKTKR